MTEIKITEGGSESAERAASLLSKAFASDPTVTYLLSSLPAAQRDAFRPRFFDVMTTAAAMNGALIHEANAWQSCGVLFRPGDRYDGTWTYLRAGMFSVLWTIGGDGSRRLLNGFSPAVTAMKKKCLRKGEKYYYVWFLGTLEEGRGKGLCSAIVRHYQDIARKEKMPIYLEAATEYCWKLYEKLGFVTVGETVVGKGEAGPDGLLKENGEGFRIWAMVWRPENVS